MLNWWSEWDALGPTLEQINMASPIMEREECQRCRSLQADVHALQEHVSKSEMQVQQSLIAVVAYEQTITHLREQIRDLREQIAVLECNLELRG